MEHLAALLAPVGTATGDTETRLARLLARLGVVRDQLGAWCENELAEDLATQGHIVCSVAKVTVSLGQAVLTRAQALTTDMAALLEHWGKAPEPVVELASRPEWLLDGWHQVCMIWADAVDAAARRAAMAEIIGLTPVLPNEVETWQQGLDILSDVLRLRRMVPLNEDWRTGVLVFKFVERNERFRALAA